MDEYELFEQLPTHTLSWRGLARSLESARVAVWLLADEMGQECFAIDSATGDLVLARTPLQGATRAFHVAYDRELARNAHLLHQDGYDVTSACGNRIAQYVLAMRPPYELFVIDQSGPELARLEMTQWLRANYPNAKFLNQPPFQRMPRTVGRKPSAWLPLASAVA